MRDKIQPRTDSHTEIKSPERTLWQMVLLAGLQHALGKPLSYYEKPKGRARTFESYRSWIGSKDFRIVCALAGIDADFILDKYHAGKIDVKMLNGTSFDMRGA